VSKVAELEAKLEAKRLEKAKAEEAQYEVDLEARIALEDEHDAIAAVKVSRFVAGQPTRAYLRTPNGAEYKRYKAQMFAAGSGKKCPLSPQQIQEQLAQACWVYPAGKEAQDAMLAAFPGLLTPLSMAAASLAEGKAEDEGKE
jgi:hypothetical protein